MSTRTLSEVEAIHEYNIDFKSNEIYLIGEMDNLEQLHEEPGVEWRVASRFIKNLNILRHKGSQDITVHMKTCGGDWQEGMAIYDSIRACPNRITIINYTHARSMSSLILLAADRRIMMPNSYFLFHYGMFCTDGTVKKAQSEFAQLEKDNETMLKIYASHLKNHGDKVTRKKSISNISKWLIDEMDKFEDVYITAEKAVELGFADEIMETYDA